VEEMEAAKAHCKASGSGRKTLDRQVRTAEQEVAMLQRLMEVNRVHHEKMMRLNIRTIWWWRFVSLVLFILWMAV